MNVDVDARMEAAGTISRAGGRAARRQADGRFNLMCACAAVCLGSWKRVHAENKQLIGF